MAAVKEIKEEGIDARNIVSWRVPNEPLASPSGERSESQDSLEKGPKPRSETKPARKKKISQIQAFSGSESDTESRLDFQNRLWRFLFSNIVRAVDELYNLCEDEENTEKCEEGIQLFEQCKRDFEKLIERMSDQAQFESGRPAPKGGISWEIRKTSMGGKRHKPLPTDEDSSKFPPTTPPTITPPRSAQSIRNEFGKSDRLSYNCSVPSRTHPRATEAISTVSTPGEGDTGSVNVVPASASKLSATATPFCPQSKPTHGIASNPRPRADTERKEKSDGGNSGKSGTDTKEHKRVLTIDTAVDELSPPDSTSTPKGSTAEVVGTTKPAPTESMETVDGAIKVEAHPHKVSVPSKPSAWVKPIHITVSGTAQVAMDGKPSLPLPSSSRAPIPSAIAQSKKKSEEKESSSEINSTKVSADEEDELEVVRESERVWEKTEAWVEAEIQAEEAAWNALYCSESSVASVASGFSSGESTPRRWSVDGISHSIFGLEVEVDSALNSYSNDMPEGGKFSPKRSDDFNDGADGENSPGSVRSHTAASHRRLHDKLSSPDRYGRSRLTPEQARQRQEARQSVAELNRDKNVMERKQKAMVASNRVRASGDREAQRIAQAEQIYTEKLREAEKRHSEYIESIRGKAGNENTKVSEVLFINSLNEGAVAEELQRNLADAEARIVAGRKRRQDMLTGIRAQQRKRNTKKVEQMSELKLALAREKMERWEKIQYRLEAVHKRREERIAELQRRSLEAKEKADKLDRGVNTSDTASTVMQDSQLQLEVDVSCPPPSSANKKSKKKSKALQKSTEQDDMALLDKIIKSTVVARGDEDDAEAMQLKDTYLQSACTKLHLNLKSDDANRDRQLVLPRTTSVDMDVASAGIHERGVALRKIISQIKEAGNTAKIVLSPREEGSEDTSSSIHSANSSSKRNKKRSLAKLSSSSPFQTADEVLIDIEPIVKRFDIDNKEHVKEFVENGGMDLCGYALDINIGCLSSPGAFWEAAADISTGSSSTLSSMCYMLKLLAQESIEDRTMSDSSDNNDTKGVNHSLAVLFSSGACVGVTDLVHFLLLSFQAWGSIHFPKALSRKSDKQQHQQYHSAKKKPPLSGKKSAKKNTKKGAPSGDSSYSSFPMGSPMSKGSSHYGMSPMGTPSKGLAGEHKTQHLVDIKWPPQIRLLLPSLLLVLSRLSQHCSRHIIALKRKPSSPLDSEISNGGNGGHSPALHWVSYVSSSGLLEGVSRTIRDVQCIAGNCGSDHVVFELLCELSSFVGHYFTLLRLYRNSVNDTPVVVHHLTDICVTNHTDPLDNDTPVDKLCSSVSSMLNESELSMHLIALLGTLLLEDTLSKRSSSGIQSADSRLSSDHQHVSVSAPVTILSYEILKTINTLCRFDLRLVQQLPMDLQALSAHITDVLFSFLFVAMEASPTDVNASNVPKSSFTAFPRKHQKDISQSLVVPPLIPQLALDTYEKVVEQLLIYVGYLCLDFPPNQDFVSVGTPPCLLVRCCNLPIRYFSDERLKQHLLPTLLAICYNNDKNLSTLKLEMSPRLLVDMLTIAQNAHNLWEVSSGTGSPTSPPEFLVEFALRFPLEYWSDALMYFEHGKM